MKEQSIFLVVIQKEGKGYWVECPELDVASQGKTVEAALKNIKEAVELKIEVLKEDDLYKREEPPLITTITVEA